MIKFNLFRKIATCGLLLSVFSLFSGCKNGYDAVITGFSFKKASNSSVTKLTKDVSATKIDEVNKIITIELPATLYSDYSERALLKASVELGAGTELITDISKLDFSENPILITVINSINSSTYVVDVKKISSTVPANSLFFTEYYSPASSELSYKGDNNQYIEITNKSKTSIDLSNVQLTRHHWEDGERRADMDQTVTLSGTLSAGSVLVIYSQRSSMFKNKDAKKFVSDRNYNSIITMNGQDGFVLSCGDTVLDCIGPENGVGNGLTWGLGKLMQRKSKIVKYTKWNESDWVTYSSAQTSVTPSTTAGELTLAEDNKTNQITYFAIENTPSVIYGIIDTSAKTVLVNIPSVYGLVHKVTASTNGKRVRYNGADVVTGVTEIDFSKATQDKPAVLKVSNNLDEVAEYKLYANILNYHFSTSPGGYYQPLTEAPKDGDVVMMYLPSVSVVIGSTADSSRLKAVEAYLDEDGLLYESGMASFAVSVDQNNNYIFTMGGKYLGCKSKSTLTLESAPSDYTLWQLKKADDGLFYIMSVGTSGCAVEYYASYTSFSTYTGYSGNSDYQFQFIKKN